MRSPAKDVRDDYPNQRELDLRRESYHTPAPLFSRGRSRSPNPVRAEPYHEPTSTRALVDPGERGQIKESLLPRTDVKPRPTSPRRRSPMDRREPFPNYREAPGPNFSDIPDVRMRLPPSSPRANHRPMDEGVKPSPTSPRHRGNYARQPTPAEDIRPRPTSPRNNLNYNRGGGPGGRGRGAGGYATARSPPRGPRSDLNSNSNANNTSPHDPLPPAPAIKPPPLMRGRNPNYDQYHNGPREPQSQNRHAASPPPPARRPEVPAPVIPPYVPPDLSTEFDAEVRLHAPSSVLPAF